MLKKYGLVIGVDPDKDKNGVATVDLATRTLSVQSLTFPETLEYFKSAYKQSKTMGEDGGPARFSLWIEAGWMNRGNWHVTESRNGKFSPSAYAAAVGQSTGECHAVSKKLLECCEYYGIPAHPIKPLRKCWKGPDRKITHAELQHEAQIYRLNFKDKRSNQEERDAALIAIVSL